MEPKRLKKSYHKLSVIHYMRIVETGETVEGNLMTSQRVISVPVTGRPIGHLRATLDLEKIFSRPEMLLRLEN